MRHSLIGVLFLALAHATIAFCDHPNSEFSGREFVEKTKGRRAYGIYLGGAKIGWGIDDFQLGEFEGRQVAVSLEESYMAIKSADEESTFRTEGRTIYDLKGDGVILFHETKSIEDGTKTTITARRTDEDFEITTKNGRKTSVRRTDHPKETLRESHRLMRWIESEPPADETFTEYTLDLELDDINSKTVYRFERKETVRWGGVSADAYHMKISMHGLSATAMVTSDGRIIRGKMGPLMEIRAEEEAVAKKFTGATVDMIEAGSVVVKRDIGRPDKIDSLRLSVRGLGDVALPESHRQKIERDEDGATIIALRRDFEKPTATALSAEQETKVTSPSTSIQSDHKSITKLAKRLVGDETDPLAKARKIHRWIGKSLRPTYSSNASTSLGVLQNRAGDCTEHALLFVALARAAGIPAREVTGLAYANEDPPAFAWHAWAEIHNGRQWISIDPMWGQVFVDATHIKFSDSRDDWGWMQLIGQLKIEILDFDGDNEDEQGGC
jgi:hypothetical protein